MNDVYILVYGYIMHHGKNNHTLRSEDVLSVHATLESALESARSIIGLDDLTLVKIETTSNNSIWEVGSDFFIRKLPIK